MAVSPEKSALHESLFINYLSAALLTYYTSYSLLNFAHRSYHKVGKGHDDGKSFIVVFIFQAMMSGSLGSSKQHVICLLFFLNRTKTARCKIYV